MKRIILFIFLGLSLLTSAQVEIATVEVTAFRRSKPDTIWGIDVSRYQGKIDWLKVDTNIKFVICKATEGTKIVDAKFNYNWENCNLIKGAYHFFRPQLSGKEQAKKYLSVISLESGNIIPIIDVEMTPYWRLKKNRSKGVKNLLQFVNFIESEIGIAPLIYTTGSFWNNYVSPYYPDKEHLLWVADYRKNPEPKTPHDMNDWIIWQFTNRGKISGIKNFVDKNVCKDIKSIQIK